MTNVWLIGKGSLKKEHVETIESLDDLSTPSDERLQKKKHQHQQNMIKKGNTNNNNKNQPKHGSIPTIVYIHTPTTTTTVTCQNDVVNDCNIVNASKKKRTNFIASFIRNFIHRSKSSRSDTSKQPSRAKNTEKVNNDNNNNNNNKNNNDTKNTVKVDNSQEQQQLREKGQPLEKVPSMKDNNHSVQSKTKTQPPGGSKNSTISTSSFSSSTTLLDLDESYNPICVTMINDTIMNINNNKNKQSKSCTDQYMKNMYQSRATMSTLRLPNGYNKQKITNHHMDNNDQDDDDDIYDEILREPSFMVSQSK